MCMLRSQMIDTLCDALMPSGNGLPVTLSSFWWINNRKWEIDDIIPVQAEQRRGKVLMRGPPIRGSEKIRMMNTQIEWPSTAEESMEEGPSAKHERGRVQEGLEMDDEMEVCSSHNSAHCKKTPILTSNFTSYTARLTAF